MSPQGVYPTADACALGDEISSSGEGRHVTLYPDNISHGSQVAVVTKGYGVWFQEAVGMPFMTQTVGTNLISQGAIDTEGIWCVDVLGEKDSGAEAVVPGEKLYINITTGQVSKINNVVNQLPFGYALGNVGSGDTERIAVKVHFDPNGWTDRAMYATFIGETSQNAFAIDVTDESTIAGGMSRGLAINYDATGIQTGTAQINALAIDMSIADDINDWMMLTLYNAEVLDKNIEIFNFISMYQESLGDDVAAKMLIDIGFNNHHATAGRDCVIRIREHDTVQALASFLRLEGGTNALGYMFDFQGTVGGEDATVIMDVATCDQTADHRIRVRIQGVGDRYIYLFPI